MNTKIFSVLLLLILPKVTFCQGTSIFLGTGYGYYNMSSLKKFQNSTLISSQRTDLRPVQSFPPYFYYNFHFTSNVFDKFNLGFVGEYFSTGGRNTYSDYSGETGIDLIIEGYSFGIFMENRIMNPITNNLLLTLAISYIYSKLEINDYLHIFSDNYKYRTSSYFSSSGFTFQPGLAYELIFSPLLIRADLSYAINTSAMFNPQQRQYSNAPSPDWTGLRFAINAGLFF